MRNTPLWLPITVMGALLVVASIVQSEIPKSTAKALQDRSPEQLLIEVRDVDKKRTARGTIDLNVSAKVLEVSKSATGLKKGDDLSIRYWLHDPEKPLPSGSYPIELVKGLTYRAYLGVADREEQIYSPKAASGSFIGAARPQAPQKQAQSGTQSKAASSRPNILIIMTDHWFSDAMSCVIGDEYLHTPAIDGLAANGMIFSRAYCANPICQPSRTSTFTGRYPHETGIQNNSKVGVDVEKFPIMGKVFKDAGYDTGYSGKTHIRLSTSPSTGKWREGDKHIHGFDFLYQDNPNRGDSPRKGDFGRVWPGMQFLKQERDKPFFLVVSCMNPHNICEWARGQKLPDGSIGDPPPLDELPPLRANHLPPEGETEVMAYMRKSYQRTSTFPVRNFDEKKWREYIWAYYRLIEKVDGEIGKLLAVLRETGQEENTLVLFTSDHGDCHCAHKWNQKTVFYDESTRVPFILSWKGKTPKGTSDFLAHTGVDPFPTLCDFAGIEPPAGLYGKSLKAPALGQEPDWKRDFIVVQNHLAQGRSLGGETDAEKRANKLSPFGRMVRSDRYKYTVYADDRPEIPLVNLDSLSGERRELERQRMLLRTTRQESLVDMQKDPGEMKNLANDPAYADVLKQHRAMLAEFCRKHGDNFRAPAPKGVSK